MNILIVSVAIALTISGSCHGSIVEGLVNKTAEVAEDFIVEGGAALVDKGIETAVDVVETVAHCNLTIEPQCPNENVTFWLYTRNNQKGVQLDLTKRNQLKDLGLEKNLPVIIIIHGYDNNRTTSPNTFIRPAYFQTGEYFIISVDYGKIAKSPCYSTAVSNLPTVSNCTAQMIDLLVTSRVVSMDRIHVIGFSLGAQISGQLSNYLRSGKLPRITGLDPALPLFINEGDDKKLDRKDAEFVDVIHTDSLTFGTIVPCGDVDFYVNGGLSQPGCENITSINVPGKAACDHGMAPKYFAESILNERGFIGKKCDSWDKFKDGKCGDDVAVMGEHVSLKTRGTYFLRTNEEVPYGLGIKGVQSDSRRETTTKRSSSSTHHDQSTKKSTSSHSNNHDQTTRRSSSSHSNNHDQTTRRSSSSHSSNY